MPESKVTVQWAEAHLKTSGVGNELWKRGKKEEFLTKVSDNSVLTSCVMNRRRFVAVQ